MLPRLNKNDAIQIMTDQGIVRFQHLPFACENSSKTDERESYFDALRRADAYEQKYIAGLEEIAGRKLTTTEILQASDPIVRDKNGRAVSHTLPVEKKTNDEARQRQQRTMEAEAERLAKIEEDRKIASMTPNQRMQYFMEDMKSEAEAADERERLRNEHLANESVQRRLSKLQALEARAETEGEFEMIAAAREAVVDHGNDPEVGEQLIAQIFDKQRENFTDHVIETHKKQVQLDELHQRPLPFLNAVGENEEERASSLYSLMQKERFPQAACDECVNAINSKSQAEVRAVLTKYAGEPA